MIKRVVKIFFILCLMMLSTTLKGTCDEVKNISSPLISQTVQSHIVELQSEKLCIILSSDVKNGDVTCANKNPQINSGNNNQSIALIPQCILNTTNKYKIIGRGELSDVILAKTFLTEVSRHAP